MSTFQKPDLFANSFPKFTNKNSKELHHEADGDATKGYFTTDKDIQVYT